MVKITAHSALAKPIALVQRDFRIEALFRRRARMARQSAKIIVGLALCLLGHAPGSAQDLWYLEPVRISDRVPTNDSVESADLQLDSEVEQAAWLQQPAGQPAAPTLDSAARRTTRGSRQANVGLATVPNMFGDLAGATTTFVGETGVSGATSGTFTLPIAGGGSRIGKISENDSPIPRDRVFFSYNHFQNVFQLSETPVLPPGPTLFRQAPLDRYTMGFEKTFYDGWTSVELRMPFMGGLNAQLPNVGMTGGNIGNLTVVLKSLLYMDGSTAVGAGLAIETPTGSSTFTRIVTSRLQFQNDSTHLLPYIGFVWSPGDPRWSWGSGLFLTGFAQMDINTTSNTVSSLGPNNTPIATLGKLTDQNLGFLDLAAGYWLYRSPDAPRLTGLAVVTELHYTTSLQDADRINGSLQGIGPFALNSTDKRFDVLNGTIGLQALLSDASSLRVAGVFPLGNENRRLFDSEVQVQFNRRF
jgi:hypothetical protein